MKALVTKVYYPSTLIIVIWAYLLLAGCSEEIVPIEQEDRSALDSLEVVIETTTDDLASAKIAKNELQRRLDSLQSIIDNAGSSLGKNADVVYTIQVNDGSRAYINGRTASLPNAIVTVSQGSTAQELTTDDTGMAVFPELESGFISVTVEIEGFSDVYMIVDLRDGGIDSNSTNADSRYASTQIMVFPTEGENMYTISGTAYYDQDVTNFRSGAANDPLHPVTGSSIFETVPSGNVFKIECPPSIIPNNTPGRPGTIVNAIYAGLTKEVAVGSDGSFSVNVPVVFLTSGGNLFNYFLDTGNSFTGTLVTPTEDVQATWYPAVFLPLTLSDINYFPGGNTTTDLYYFKN